MNIERLVSDALLGFCRQQIEPLWAHLNQPQPQPQHYTNLWRELADMGVALAITRSSYRCLGTGTAP